MPDGGGDKTIFSPVLATQDDPALGIVAGRVYWISNELPNGKRAMAKPFVAVQAIPEQGIEKGKRYYRYKACPGCDCDKECPDIEPDIPYLPADPVDCSLVCCRLPDDSLATLTPQQCTQAMGTIDTTGACAQPAAIVIGACCWSVSVFTQDGNPQYFGCYEGLTEQQCVDMAHNYANVYWVMTNWAGQDKTCNDC